MTNKFFPSELEMEEYPAALRKKLDSKSREKLLIQTAHWKLNFWFLNVTNTVKKGETNKSSVKTVISFTIIF